MRGELNGYGIRGNYEDLRARAREVTQEVLAIIATDSRGAYDAVNQMASAGLGSRRSRTAVEAAALKQVFNQEKNVLIWLSSDWNISDGLTKEKSESRRSLEAFMRTGRWRLRFDPNFIIAARKAAQGAVDIMKEVDEPLKLKMTDATKIKLKPTDSEKIELNSKELGYKRY